MDRIYWLMIRDEKGQVVDIREATWDYFHKKNGDYRANIKRLLYKVVINNESFEFALKSNFENRGIIYKYKKEYLD